jgi:hypothetical protein
MSLIEVLLVITVALLAGTLFTARAILRLTHEDRTAGHINAVYQINEALHRVSGHEGGELVPQILKTLETLDCRLAEIEVSTSELRHAPWRNGSSASTSYQLEP